MAHPNAQRVQAAAAAAGAEVEIRELPVSTRTAAEAAAALGVAVGQIAKSSIFLAGGRPVMVVASGANRVGEAKVSARFGGAPITRADADAVRAATGYPIGGVSPAGLDRALPVLVDRTLAAYDVVWVAAGTPNAVFPTTFDQLLQISSGEPADVAEG